MIRMSGKEPILEQGLTKKDVQQETKRIDMKRRAVVLSITTIFVVTAVILVTAVVHEELQKVGDEEFLCAESDSACWEMFCPQGWLPVKQNNTCQLIEGFSCCPQGFHLCGESEYVRCFNSSEGNSQPDCSCKVVSLSKVQLLMLIP